MTSSHNLVFSQPLIALPSAYILFTLFTQLSLCILSTCPDHLSLPLPNTSLMYLSPILLLSSSFAIVTLPGLSFKDAPHSPNHSHLSAFWPMYILLFHCPGFIKYCTTYTRYIQVPFSMKGKPPHSQ